MNISKYVTLKEAVRSVNAIKLGIDNTPTPEHLENLKALSVKIYDPLREHFGPIFISQGYRSDALNKKTPGSSKTSYHCSGRAYDLDDTLGAGRYTNKDIFLYVLHNLQYAELIWEHGSDGNPDWVHVAFHEGKNVKETLRTKVIPDPKKPGKMKTVYVNFDISQIK